MSSIDRVRIIVAGDSGDVEIIRFCNLGPKIVSSLHKKNQWLENLCDYHCLTDFVLFWSLGCGKSSLAYLIANNEILQNPPYTVGVSVEVKLHEYKEDTQFQKTFFIEVSHWARWLGFLSSKQPQEEDHRHNFQGSSLKVDKEEKTRHRLLKQFCRLKAVMAVKTCDCFDIYCFWTGTWIIKL